MSMPNMRIKFLATLGLVVFLSACSGDDVAEVPATDAPAALESQPEDEPADFPASLYYSEDAGPVESASFAELPVPDGVDPNSLGHPHFALAPSEDILRRYLGDNLPAGLDFSSDTPLLIAVDRDASRQIETLRGPDGWHVLHTPPETEASAELRLFLIPEPMASVRVTRFRH